MLVVNVFFPPQAIGGATRVVTDQISELSAKYSKKFEVGVLCGNDEDGPSYHIEAYSWNGVPVWSVSTPKREHMDWIHDDPQTAPLIQQVIASFRPDLVHIHCIQRLTLSVVKEVAAFGVPYVVTVHDGWWISDHQFFMDKACRLQMPWKLEQHKTSGNPHERGASATRKLALRAALAGANSIVAVSESFAKLYKRAGIQNVDCLPNGLSLLPPLEVAASSSPYIVRVGHIGGAVHHKGYFLLKQVLMEGAYDRVEALVCDHSMPPGSSRQEQWGASNVTVIGRIDQSRIGWLYGQFDVLAAPSLWPESYGLVAREALAYGRWVIASNLGAIAEDVVPGKSGWIIDVSSTKGMRRVIQDLQANPERYKRSPAVRRLRTATEMARDVANLWSQVLAGQSATVP